MKEQIKHIEAFEYYFNLIEKGHTLSNSIRATSEHYNVSERTVWNWYNKLGWEKKEINKKAEIAQKVAEQTNREYSENRVRYLQVLHKILDNFINEGFPVKIESAKDLEIIIRNCLVLQDKPTEFIKTKNINENIKMEELFDEDLISQIIDEEK